MKDLTGVVESTTVTDMSNRYEVEARKAKALRLATVLFLAGATAADLSDQGVRDAAVAAAGTRNPSETTWDLVAVFLDGKAA